jgi:hypothetical protein
MSGTALKRQPRQIASGSCASHFSDRVQTKERWLSLVGW